MVETIIDARIEYDLKQISNIQLLLECLELRLALLGQNNSVKTEFEKNEDDILMIKTQIEINKYNAIVTQKSFDVIDNLKMLEIESNG